MGKTKMILVQLWIVFQICNMVTGESLCEYDWRWSNGSSVSRRRRRVIKTENSVKLCNQSNCKEYSTCNLDKIYGGILSETDELLLNNSIAINNQPTQSAKPGEKPGVTYTDQCCRATHKLRFVVGWNEWLTDCHGHDCHIFPRQIISTVKCGRGGSCGTCLERKKPFTLLAWCPGSWIYKFHLFCMNSYCLCANAIMEVTDIRMDDTDIRMDDTDIIMDDTDLE